MRLLGVLILAITSTTTAEGMDLSFCQRATAACSAYVVGTVLTSPLDVLKTQSQATGARAGPALLHEIVARGGVGALFRGLGPSLLMAPGMVVQYTLYDELRKVLPAATAACVAGAVDITLKTPFERAKTLSQANTAGMMRGSGGGAPNSVLAQVVCGVRANGVASLWRGYGATLARDIPYVVVYWTTYDALRRLLFVDADPDTRMAKSFISGAIAGTLAATLVTPADVVKTHVQVSGTQSTLKVIKGLARRGPGAFFQGLSARLIRTPIYAGITLSSFEALKLKMAQN